MFFIHHNETAVAFHGRTLVCLSHGLLQVPAGHASDVQGCTREVASAGVRKCMRLGSFLRMYIFNDNHIRQRQMF